MNASQLLVHFDRISEAPDAVPKLRAFILDLAVRGKLSEQSPDDESAVELLRKLRRQGTEAALTDQPRPVRYLQGDSKPFPLPCGWEWAYFGDLAEFRAGRTPPRQDERYWNTGDHAWVSIADMRDGEVLVRTKETVSGEAAADVFRGGPVPAGTLLMSFKLTIGKMVRLGIPSFHNEAIIAVFPRVPGIDDYLFKVLPLFARRGDTKDAIKGATLNRDSIDAITIPLPPLAEQHRIVAKVDELMGLCDRFEDARQQRACRRDRLVAASLWQVNAPTDDPKSGLGIAAAFHFEHFEEVTTDSDHVESLRQTILRMAVRGKLVPQGQDDEPADRLLGRIADKSHAPLSSRRTRKREMSVPIDERPAPFELPMGWTWAKFHELGEFHRGKSRHRPRNDSSLYSGGTFPLVQTGDVARAKGVVSTYTALYNASGLAQSQLWPAGTLCITIAANIADSAVLGFDACIPDSVVGFVPNDEFENARYFDYFMKTAKADLEKFAPSTAQKNINVEILQSVLIPLPPLREQTRIVAKVDELMALCDRLEERLGSKQIVSGRLLDAVLAQALVNIA